MLGDNASVVVENGQHRFILPEMLLFERCAYFKTALDGHFMEASEKELKMPHVDADVFELAICYFITEGIEYISKTREMERADAAEAEKLRLSHSHSYYNQDYQGAEQRQNKCKALHAEERANLRPLLQLCVLADELDLGLLELHLAHRIS